MHGGRPVWHHGQLHQPGAIESPRFQARSEEMREAHRRVIALDRFGEPEEIAQMVLFLASDQAQYITGAGLVQSGVTVEVE